MNKYWYDSGNIFKVKFRKHRCYKCDSNLTIVKHRKVVDQKSEEAKYYTFYAGGMRMIGPCEFIHNVFYCPKCLEQIEFATQITQEDIDIIIEKVKRYFSKRGRIFQIKKTFENNENEIVTSIKKIEEIKNLRLVIEEDGNEKGVYKVPLGRYVFWERPYYFNLKKRKLIEYIKNNC